MVFEKGYSWRGSITDESPTAPWPVARHDVEGIALYFETEMIQVI